MLALCIGLAPSQVWTTSRDALHGKCRNYAILCCLAVRGVGCDHKSSVSLNSKCLQSLGKPAWEKENASKKSSEKQHKYPFPSFPKCQFVVLSSLLQSQCVPFNNYNLPFFSVIPCSQSFYIQGLGTRRTKAFS